jgi:hypothetical protein
MLYRGYYWGELSNSQLSKFFVSEAIFSLLLQRMSSEREQKQLEDASQALAGRFQDIKTSLRDMKQILEQCCGSGSTRIHMFLGLLDPDPSVRDMDPDLDPSITKQKR